MPERSVYLRAPRLCCATHIKSASRARRRERYLPLNKDVSRTLAGERYIRIRCTRAITDLDFRNSGGTLVKLYLFIFFAQKNKCDSESQPRNVWKSELTVTDRKRRDKKATSRRFLRGALKGKIHGCSVIQPCIFPSYALSRAIIPAGISIP